MLVLAPPDEPSWSSLVSTSLCRPACAAVPSRQPTVIQGLLLQNHDALDRRQEGGRGQDAAPVGHHAPHPPLLRHLLPGVHGGAGHLDDGSNS